MTLRGSGVLRLLLVQVLVLSALLCSVCAFDEEGEGDASDPSTTLVPVSDATIDSTIPDTNLGFGSLVVFYGGFNEISRAFQRLLTEMRVGKSRRDALRDLSDRVDVPDVTSFIAALIQADTLGISIAKVLRIQSEQMRIKRRQRAEEKAQQAPIKMLIPMTFLIFPTILIVILGPAVLILKGSAIFSVM